MRLHVFWLSGFIFFGSSNGLFERIRRVIDAQVEKPVGYVVLDFSAVPGLDTSAVFTFIKLRNYCDEHGVTLVFSGRTNRCGRASTRPASSRTGTAPSLRHPERGCGMVRGHAADVSRGGRGLGA